MSDAMPPLPNTPTWPGAHLMHSDNFTFTYSLIRKSLFTCSNYQPPTLTSTLQAIPIWPS
jgi:hypothetical protein